MDDIDPIFVKLDQLIRASRLNELGVMMSSGPAQRIARMAEAIRQLRPGAYLLGTGPSTVGIIPLAVDEVVLGRSATTVEEPSETIVDYAVADTLYFGPHEVSRAHAKIVRAEPNADTEYRVVDLESTCGTFVNDEQVDPGGISAPLSHGDAISLGPSQVSTYLFYVSAFEDTEP